MKTIKFYSILTIVLLGLAACEGHNDDGYDNAGLSDAEQAHTRAIIDSALVVLKRDLAKADSLADGELRKEITLLREEIESLKKKK
jgi:hypothetical protein